MITKLIPKLKNRRKIIVQYRIQRSIDKSEYIDTTSWDDVVNKSIKKG